MKNRAGLGCLLLTMLCVFVLPSAAQEAVFFPTTGWPTSTPEEQGMDSAKLAELVEQLQPGTETIHSLLIIRNGSLVLDVSAYPFRSDEPHWLYSAVKSITSTLVGIAIDRGYIEGVDQSIWDFFPQETAANMDERKAAITIRHLLTHTSGLMMWRREDVAMFGLTAADQSWVQYVLDMPMATEPGTTFNYLDANTQLLSAIVAQATGMSMAEFAQEVLFTPLGITPSTWRSDPQGVNWGGDGLAVSAQDMAKLAYLYLHHGEWDGQTIVSPEWIEAASTFQTSTQLELNYGYLWWLDDTDEHPKFAAWGHGGQETWVIPDEDLIVVLTGDDNMAALTWIDAFVFPAVVSDEALPANPQAAADLSARIEALQAPTAAAVPVIPEQVAEIAGRRIALADNELLWDSVLLSFVDDEAVLSVSVAGTPLELPFGLDGVYRMTVDGALVNGGLPWGPFWAPLSESVVAGRLVEMRDNGMKLRFWDLSGGQGWDFRIRVDEMLTIQITNRLSDDFIQLEGGIQ